MILSRFALALALVGGTEAVAQIQNQPVEIVRAAPLSSFSERAGAWPSYDIPEDRLTSDRSDLSERMNQVPGLQMRTNGSPVLSIRGSGQADRTLRLFEGLPLNMADGVGASEFFLPTEVLGSLSLIKGPASVFYGGSAMAGALDHRLKFFDGHALRVLAADDGGWLGPRSVLGVAALPRNATFEKSQISLFHERTPGRYPFVSTSTTRSGRRESSAADLTRATIASDARLGSWSLRLRSLGGKSVGESPGALTFPFASTYDTTVSLASLEARRDFDEGEFLSLRLSDSRIWGLYDRDTATSSSSVATRSALSVDDRTMLGGIGARTFGDLVTQSIGASYLGSARFHQFDADVGQSWEVPVSASWMLQPSYRYRSSSGHWAKALGLLNDSGPSRRFLTYSEGYRTASLSDRFGNYGTFRGNPSLKPESSWSVETGFVEERGERYGAYLDGWALGASTYFTRYTDLVDSQTVGATQTKANVGEARALGLEVNAATSLSVWLLSLSYNYLDAKNETVNEPLRLSPHHQLAVSVAQQLGPVLIELRDTYWSEFADRDPASGALVTLPSWTTVDLEFRSVGLTDWEVRAGVLNVFDRPRELTLGYPEPQRRVFASALRSF